MKKTIFILTIITTLYSKDINEIIYPTIKNTLIIENMYFKNKFLKFVKNNFSSSGLIKRKDGYIINFKNKRTINIDQVIDDSEKIIYLDKNKIPYVFKEHLNIKNKKHTVNCKAEKKETDKTFYNYKIVFKCDDYTKRIYEQKVIKTDELIRIKKITSIQFKNFRKSIKKENILYIKGNRDKTTEIELNYIHFKNANKKFKASLN